MTHQSVLTLDALKKEYRARLEYLKKLSVLMDEIFSSALSNYRSLKRMHPRRMLCMGSISIAKRNIDASVLLIETELSQQVHYISRNMYELTANLYYILDDESVWEQRLERYRRHSGQVLPYKVMRVMEKYPQYAIGINPDKDFPKKKNAYAEFKQKYEVKGKKFNDGTWSGKKLDLLIESLKDTKDKEALMEFYHSIVKQNNFFLHPSWFYLMETVKESVAKADGRKDEKSDFKDNTALLTMMFLSGRLVVSKFLDHFPKGRPEFLKRLADIDAGFQSAEAIKLTGG